MTTRWLSLLLVLVFFSCDNGREFNYTLVPTFSKNSHLNCIVETPAGIKLKHKYDPTSNKFVLELKQGVELPSNFPQPFNYGFVASTEMSEERGGNGQPLGVFVIANDQLMGAVVETKPIGVAKLLKNDEIHDKLIAIPVNTEIETVSQLDQDVRDKALELIVRCSEEGVEFDRWGEAEEAKDVVEKWKK